MQTYKVQTGQNIFDIAVMLHGSVEGIFDLFVNNPELSFENGVSVGDELLWDEDFIVHDSIVSHLKENNIVPANGERHVYYKECSLPIRIVIKVPADEPQILFTMSGDGDMIVDWGDNTDLETVHLDKKEIEYYHFFDNESDVRTVKLYGDFNIKRFDASKINGSLLPVAPITVDEFVCDKNNLNLTGLFLFKGTYMVSLSQMYIKNLNSIRDMSLQSLVLNDNEYGDEKCIDDYLIYISQNNNQRRNCHVVLDKMPSGEYKEPKRNSNGNYVIETGMEAIYVITHEVAWNEAGAWVFDINGKTYKYENQDIA